MKLIKYAVGAGIIGYLATVYAVDHFDQNLSEQKEQNATLSHMNALSSKAFNVFAENGCEYCHTKNSEMPFYANLPIAKQLMERDVRNAQRQFNISGMLENMQQGKPISDVDLAKLESVLEDGSMPPKLYLTMHWRSDLSDNEKNTLLDWVRQQRAEQHANTGVTAEFKYAAVQPITTTFKVNQAKVKLGDELYHDTRLSSDNTVSCATCHDLNRGGVDRLNTSTGVGGAKGPINAPTVFNAVFNIHQFWDGRAFDLQAQAGGPPLNPKEMASTSWNQIITKLDKDPVLKAQFDALYKQGITEETITDAIAEFEKTLVTPNSRFDKYMRGDKSALNAEEIAGYKLFNKYKCQTCHAGEAMGGQTFEILGVKKDYFADRGTPLTDADKGRIGVTNDPNDLHRFKVPTLRNVAQTAPYFHDANAKTLDDAVNKMALYQVGVTLQPQETKEIVAYLKTLTGEYNGKLVQ
ncbi:c-type cytochrome [Photobacterium damselae]|nr:c-type cytochrome [Photobacterium damselae]